MQSEFFKISTALKVISPRFPIGVGIKYSPFFISLLWFFLFAIITTVLKL